MHLKRSKKKRYKMNVEWLRLLFEVVLGGGWIVSVMTIRSTRKKGRAEALQAEMELGRSYVEEFTKNIAEPLKEKVNDLEKAANGLKRETARLRKAINKTNNCQWVDSCPVVRELQNTENHADADSDVGQTELFGEQNG